MMSFSLTTPQIWAKTKTVTRRLGWANLKPGDRLMAIEKGQGLKKGEKVKRICEIEVVSNKAEPLDNIAHYGPHEVGREGFIHMNLAQFVGMFCKHNKCSLSTVVNRIEFKYV